MTVAEVSPNRPFQLLFERADPSPILFTRPEPNLAQMLFQGSVVGTVTFFFYILGIMISSPNFYNFLYIPYLPKALGAGIGQGVFIALIIWTSTKLVGKHLWTISRVLIAWLSTVLFWALLIDSRRTDQAAILVTIDWHVVAFFIAIPVCFGLIVGSRLKLWRPLLYGIGPMKTKPQLATCITRFSLVLATVFFLMESVVTLIALKSVAYQKSDLQFVLLAVSHFSVGALLALIRIRFILSSALALIVNIPVFILFNKQNGESWFLFCLIFGYLALWSSFLLSKSKLVTSVSHIVAEEFRYYLID